MSLIQNTLVRILFAGASALATVYAHASDRLMIPFSCEADRNGVYARPSAGQSYAIIGPRESAPFTACANGDPTRCRTMMLHKFDLECDGERISWPEFYAAIADLTTGRARIDNGRLLVRVTPQRRRQVNRPQFERGFSRRSFLVEMPDGFAPVRGTVARFSGKPSVQSPSQATAPPRPVNSPPNERAATPRKALQPGDVDTKDPAKPTLPKKVAAPEKKPFVIDVPDAKRGTNKKAIQEKTTTTAKTPIKPEGQTKPSPNLATAQQNKKRNVSQKDKALVDKKSGAPRLAVRTPPQPKNENAPVVPTLLNGSKAGQAALKKTTKPAEKTDQKNVKKPEDEREPNSIGELITQADENTANPLEKTGTLAAGNKLSGQTRAIIEPAPPPSLAGTLSVFAVVGAMLLGICYGAYRFMLPSPQPQRPAHKLSAPIAPRPATDLPSTKAVPDLSLRTPHRNEPSLAAMGQSPPKPVLTSATPSDEKQSKEQTSNKNISSGHEMKAGPSLSVPADTVRAPNSKGPDRATPRQNGSTKDGGLKIPEQQLPTTNKTNSDPELPMPDIIADQIKPPDFEASALVLPKTRGEALAALGMGGDASDAVVERVVSGLRQCWSPDDAKDETDHTRRLQRMQQIETAWRILSKTPGGDDNPAKPPR